MEREGRRKWRKRKKQNERGKTRKKGNCSIRQVL